MGSTKIINVLKNDNFEDVLDAFQKTEAEEVIFIFPKNSLLSKKEQHFAQLASEAEKTNKQISVITADQNIENYAEKYGLRFMAQPIKSKKTPVLAKIEAKPQLEEVDNGLGDETENHEEQLAELTMASPRKTSKTGTANKKLEKLESFWGGFNLSLIKRGGGHHKLNLLLISSAVAALLLTLFIFLGNAQIIIKPQKQKIHFELPVSVSTNLAKTDAMANQIPGQFLAFRADVSKDFPSTGEEELVRKARGELTVFNNFNSDPQGLRATTRFESSKGLIFRTPRAIIVPGAKLVNGKLVPGSMTVEVIADKPGQEYNINADRFTIPGFAGTPKFEGFYAESSQPMSGGMIGLSKVVTEKDFNSAKDLVTKESLAKSLENLKTKKGELEIVEPITNNIISLKSTAEIDDSADGFAIAATAEAKTIGFSKEDLLKLIEASLNKNGRWMLLEEGLRVDYTNIKFDFAKNTLNFTATTTGTAVARIEEEKIIDGLPGLKQNKIENYLLGFKEIESARVILSPFWVKSIPKDKQDIRIKIVY
ncbi:MAG: Uncharacterized protein G01um101444_366 [Parcubacteria group bacterium Gr01-1014_44]|nr:MAG: Uncharacterized protein G01um101444_366 [Parcubacteria group bacterium Gr01-1014_44]